MQYCDAISVTSDRCDESSSSPGPFFFIPKKRDGRIWSVSRMRFHPAIERGFGDGLKDRGIPLSNELDPYLP